MNQAAPAGGCSVTLSSSLAVLNARVEVNNES
jgi:hypothetical protein